MPVLPGGGFLEERGKVGNPPVEALGGEDAEFNLCHIQPAARLGGEVQFQPFGQTPGFCGGKGFKKRGEGMGVKVLTDQRNLLLLWKVLFQ